MNIAGTVDNVLPIHAASSSSTRCVKEIIKMYPKQLSSKDVKDGGTPLHWAKSREIIEALLEANTNINAKNFKGLYIIVIYSVYISYDYFRKARNGVSCKMNSNIVN